VQGEFRGLLERGDAQALVSAWGQMFPGMPKPESLEHAEIAMHMARTGASTVTFRARAWSHAWLLERSLPSQLPDELKPRAQRLHPVIVDAVVVGKPTMPKWLEPVAVEMQGAMIYAVEDCYANGDKEPEIVRGRMQEARETTQRKLLGNLNME